MKKKILLGLIIVIALISTGCNKEVEEEQEIHLKAGATYSCFKGGIDKQTTSGILYNLDLRETVSVDDDGKLIYYSYKAIYTFNSVEECETSCSSAVKYNDEYNKNNHLGLRKVTECACDKKQFSEDRVYDDIPNLDSSLRSDISYLNEDNSFNLGEFLNALREKEYSCK